MEGRAREMNLRACKMSRCTFVFAVDTFVVVVAVVVVWAAYVGRVSTEDNKAAFVCVA